MMTDLLTIDDLHLTVDTIDGPVHILRGVTLSVAKGERVAIVGESGSGKSATARVLMGLFPEKKCRMSGNIIFDGAVLLQDGKRPGRSRSAERQMAMIFQDPTASLNPFFTIREQFSTALLRTTGVKDRRCQEKVMTEALREVAIADPERVLSSYSFQLSGGINQRVMIAIATAGRQKLLIADEPGTALDVTVQSQTLKIMGRISEDHGNSILFISHNFGAVRNFVSRVCVMNKGQIVEVAPTRELIEAPRHPYTKSLLAAVPRLSSDALPVFEPVEN